MYCSTEEAILKLKSGDVVALPTETVYGLAASVFDKNAIHNIFSIKGRPLIDPLIVHILNFDWLSRCSDLDCKILLRAQKIADTFWPGPITIIVHKKKCIDDLITAGKDTVAIRCPDHKIFREILFETDFPIAAPSANPFGYVSPTKAEHVELTLGDKVSVVDGGHCAFGLESTIVDLSNDTVRVLRPGAILHEEIEKCLGEKIEKYRHVDKLTDVDCPGQLKKHYSPKTKLILIKEIKNYKDLFDQTTQAMILLKRPNVISDNVFWLSEDGDLNTVAKNVFDVLQKLDKLGFEEIFCQVTENVGIGVAINDRLGRAAAKI